MSIKVEIKAIGIESLSWRPHFLNLIETPEFLIND